MMTVKVRARDQTSGKLEEEGARCSGHEEMKRSLRVGKMAEWKKKRRLTRGQRRTSEESDGCCLEMPERE